MIYNGNTFQKLFITGRYTLIFLLGGALLLWVAGCLCVDIDISQLNLQLPYTFPRWVEHVVSFALYMCVALILNSFIIIEGRTPWMGGIMMWYTGLFISLQSDVFLPLSLLMLFVALSLLLLCHQSIGVERRLFVAFMALAVCSLFFPQFAYMLPVFLLYPVMVSVMSARGLVAAFLGLITPYWLYLGTMFICSMYDVAWSRVIVGLNSICVLDFVGLSIQNIALFGLELVVMIVSAALLMSGSNPAKPLMRKTLRFFIIMNLYLWIVALFKEQDYNMLLAWRLPGLALMSAYIYSYRITKLFNIYFVILNIWWLAAAILGVWNGL